jgi:hypothetical protein
VSIPSVINGNNAALISRKIVADVPTKNPSCINNFTYAGSLVNGQTVTGNLNDLNGFGKTIEELQQEITYSALGWDFEIWKMGNSEFPYPIPRWLDEISLPAGYIPLW